MTCQYIEVFHGSHERITRFGPLSHFGTREAAKAVLERRDRDEGVKARRQGFLHRCHIRRPAKIHSIPDTGTPRPLALLLTLQTKGCIVFDPDPKTNHQEFMKHRKHLLNLACEREKPNVPRHFRAERDYVTSILLQYQISVVEYYNEVEGDGEKSFVAIDQSLIEIMSIEDFQP